MASSRPEFLPNGTCLKERYTIEGLVRIVEGRFFYLAKADDARLYLLSARWKLERFDAYMTFSSMNLQHPGIITPTDVFIHNDQLFSVIPYSSEGLLIDEVAPLSNERVLHLAQRLAGILAFLHSSGVHLHHLTNANIFVNPDGTVRLFDPEISHIDEDPKKPSERSSELRSLGELLRRFCNVDAEALADFLETVESGTYPTPAAFGRAVEQRFDAVAGIQYQPILAATTDVGLVRDLNEDNWGWSKLSKNAALYVVADGMGGHDGGEIASELAVRTICQVARERESLRKSSNEALENLLDESFQEANNTVKTNAEVKGTDMGTTLVCLLLLDEHKGFVANVGDSRAYLFRSDELSQISEDHSLVGKMVERGKLTKEEARIHPHSNILLRTVGTERNIDIDVFPVDLQSGDRVLLCSDGLWGEIPDEKIGDILLNNPDPRTAVRELVHAAHLGGGKDNVTVMVIKAP